MILDAFKFTNSLFSSHFSKYLVVVFPVFVIIFIAYLLLSSVQGNEFGTTTSFNYQELVTNLFIVYASILTILLTDDIYKERKRNVSSYFSIGALLYFKVFLISIISGIATVLGFILVILPGLYILGRITFASYLAVVFNERIFDSFKKSIEITQDKGWKVLGYILAMVVPLMLIMILALIGPAVLLLPGNMTAYMGITTVLTFFLTVYMTIYIYRLLLNLTNSSNESI